MNLKDYQDYTKNGYVVVPNLISEDPTHALCALDLKPIAEKQVKRGVGDNIETKDSFNSVHDAFWPLHLQLTKTIQDYTCWIPNTLVPTYYYQRTYTNGAILPKHRDRHACQVSVSLHLGSDKPWEFTIGSQSVTLNPSDAVIYKGTEVYHERATPFAGNFYSQLFLHYVHKNGTIKIDNSIEETQDHYYDGLNTPEQIKNHYVYNYMKSSVVTHNEWIDISERKLRTGTYHKKGD